MYLCIDIFACVFYTFLNKKCRKDVEKMANNTRKNSIEIVEKIIECMKKNPDYKAIEIARSLGFSRQIVSKYYKTCKRYIQGEINEWQLNNNFMNKKASLVKALKKNPFATMTEINQETGLSSTFIRHTRVDCQSEIPLRYYAGKKFQIKRLRTLADFVKSYYLLPEPELNEILQSAKVTKEPFTIGSTISAMKATNGWKITFR